MEDYQALCRQLEAVECSVPTVGLVEETEERLTERISLYQVNLFYSLATYRNCSEVCFFFLNQWIIH